MTGDSGPVTVAVERKVVPGRELDYEDWVRGVTADALEFPGHMGVNVIRPNKGSRIYVTIFRFDNYEHCRAWEDSGVRRAWLDRLAGITEGEDQVRKTTGLEFWFSLPELPALHPSPHKMAVVLIVVVFLLVLLLNLLLDPVTAEWPMPARLLVVAVLQVTLMTYLVMPQVTRLLESWLRD
tara:strand:+ start:60 stop:602 length:543 start_codon:yes stop_codon:yes gene_type:complete